MSLLPIPRASTGQSVSDVKAQPIRLLDVFFIGPTMLVGGLMLAKKGSPVIGGVLSVLGASTVAYNARNYALIEQRLTIRR